MHRIRFASRLRSSLTGWAIAFAVLALGTPTWAQAPDPVSRLNASGQGTPDSCPSFGIGAGLPETGPGRGTGAITGGSDVSGPSTPGGTAEDPLSSGLTINPGTDGEGITATSVGEAVLHLNGYSPPALVGRSMGIGMIYRAHKGESATKISATDSLQNWHLTVLDKVTVTFAEDQNSPGDLGAATPTGVVWLTGTGDKYTSGTPAASAGPSPDVWFSFTDAVFDQFRLVPPVTGATPTPWRLERYFRDGHVMVYQLVSSPVAGGVFTTTWRPEVFYDPFDNARTYAYDSSDRLSSITDQRGVVVTLTWTTSSCDVTYSKGSTSFPDQAWSFDWLSGRLSEFNFPKTDYVEKGTHLMDLGNVITTDPAGYRFIYDSAGLLEKVRYTRDPDYVASDPATGIVLLNVYEQSTPARLKCQSDRHGRLHNFSYNTSGSVFKVTYSRPETQNASSLWDLDVDAQGRITKVKFTPGTKPRGTEPASLTWLYEYSSCTCSKPSKITYPSGTSISMTYTEGKILSATVLDPSTSGATTVYNWTYEHLDRGFRPATFIPPSPGADLTWTYTWQARAHNLFGEKPITVIQKTSAVSLENGGSHILQSELTYLSDGRVSSTRDTGNQLYIHTYYTATEASRNLLLKQISRSPISGDTANLTLFDYSALGLVTKVQNGPVTDLTTTEITRDAWGRLKTVKTSPNGTINYEVEYHRDRYENIAVMRRRNLDHGGAAPTYDDGTGSGRAWVRNEWHYEYELLQQSFIDRRPLADGSNNSDPFTISNPWMVTYSYEYKLNGELEKVTLPNGSVNTYVTDGYGTLFKMLGDVNGANVELGQSHFNTNLQLVKQRQIVGPATYAETTYARNHSGYGFVTSVTDPTGVKVETDLDVLGRAFRTKAIGSDSQTYAITEVEFDQIGRAMRVKRKEVGTSNWATTKYLYNKRSQATDIEAPLGRKMERVYDAYGRLEYARDHLNGTASQMNEVQLLYKPGRDWVETAISKVFEEDDITDQSSGTQKSYHTAYTYDLLGRTTSVTSTGLTSGEPPLTSTYGYDSHGNMTFFQDAGQQGNNNLYSRTVFDAAGRWTEFVKRSGPNVGDRIRLESEYTDKQAGSTHIEVARWDGNGFLTRHEYDGLYRLTEVYRPGYTTGQPHHKSYTYDEGSRIKQVTDGNGNVFTNTYDLASRLLERSVNITNPQVSNLVDKEIFTYDPVGRMKTQGTYLGSLLVAASAYDRDNFGRITDESFYYYGVSQNHPVTISSGYSFTGSTGVGDPSFRRTLNYSDSLQLRTTPDTVARLKQIHGKVGAGGTERLFAQYRYSGGQINQREQYANGTQRIVSDLAFDGHRRLLSMTEKVGGTTHHQESFGYDDVGNITKHEYTKVNAAQAGDLYDYDEFHRLTGAKLGVNGTDIIGTFAAATSAAKTLTYNLDPGNNRQSVTTKLGTNPATTSTYTLEANSPRYASVSNIATTFAYDGEGNLIWDGRFLMKYDFKNRLTEVYAYATQGTNLNAPNSNQRQAVPVANLRTAQQEIEKKAKGDLRGMAATRPSEARADVQTSSSSSQTGELVLVALYSYDTFNRRLYRHVPQSGLDLRYAYDGWREVEELVPTPDNGDVKAVAQKAFVWGVGIDAMIAYYRKESSTWVDYYPIQNSKGSIVKLMTNGAANTPSLEPQLIEEVEYDPYGTATVHVGGGQQPTSSKGNPYLFQGRRHDPETGFYYFRNRYLDTTLGRFLTNDPIGAWGDAANDGNALAFAGNNPSTNLDPSGLTTIGGKGPGPAKSGGGFSLPIGALGAGMPMEPSGPTYTDRDGDDLPPGIMSSLGNRNGDESQPDCPCASQRKPAEDPIKRMERILQAQKREWIRQNVRRPTCMDCHGDPAKLRGGLLGAEMYGTKSTENVFKGVVGLFAVGAALVAAPAVAAGASSTATAVHSANVAIVNGIGTTTVSASYLVGRAAVGTGKALASMHRVGVARIGAPCASRLTQTGAFIRDARVTISALTAAAISRRSEPGSLLVARSFLEGFANGFTGGPGGPSFNQKAYSFGDGLGAIASFLNPF